MAASLLSDLYLTREPWRDEPGLFFIGGSLERKEMAH